MVTLHTFQISASNTLILKCSNLNIFLVYHFRGSEFLKVSETYLNPTTTYLFKNEKHKCIIQQLHQVTKIVFCFIPSFTILELIKKKKKHRKMKKVQPENNITISVSAYNSFTLNENTKI